MRETLNNIAKSFQNFIFEMYDKPIFGIVGFGNVGLFLFA